MSDTHCHRRHVYECERQTQHWRRQWRRRHKRRWRRQLQTNHFHFQCQYLLVYQQLADTQSASAIIILFGKCRLHDLLFLYNNFGYCFFFLPLARSLPPLFVDRPKTATRRSHSKTACEKRASPTTTTQLRSVQVAACASRHWDY